MHKWTFEPHCIKQNTVITFGLYHPALTISILLSM